MASEVDVGAQLTFVELAKRTNNKETLEIATVLAKLTPVIGDATWVEANQLTSHVHNREERLAGTGTWRDINEGVAPTAGQTQQITEQIGYLEDRSEIDERLVELAPEPQAFRFNEDLLHMRGLAQTIETAFWYGSRATAPKTINGFTTRYNGLSLTPDNVQTAGSSATNTSVWIIKWGMNSVYNIYPRNSKTLGIERNDKGLELITTNVANATRLYEWVTQFKFNIGICVRNDLAVQRLANINGSKGAAANVVDENKLIEMYNDLPGGSDGAVMYCNKAVMTQLAIKAKDKPNVIWPTKDPFGKPVLMFWDIPIHVSEMITSAETTVA